MSAVSITYKRLSEPRGEEGRRQFAYDDSTGKRVTCLPAGNLSIAVGVNLETGLDDEEIDWLSQHRLAKVATQLAGYSWYAALDEARQSVCLDVAFNQGLHGLLHYPKMVAALSHQDWETAANECDVADPRLKPRYEKLAQILRTGVV